MSFWVMWWLCWSTYFVWGSLSLWMVTIPLDPPFYWSEWKKEYPITNRRWLMLIACGPIAATVILGFTIKTYIENSFLIEIDKEFFIKWFTKKG